MGIVVSFKIGSNAEQMLERARIKEERSLLKQDSRKKDAAQPKRPQKDGCHPNGMVHRICRSTETVTDIDAAQMVRRTK
jgi:hypothetical protein